MIGYTFEEIFVGMSASFTKTITETDVTLFAGISGDLNPMHVNEQFARGTIFQSRIAHGMLTGSLFTTIIGMYLPGPGSIYLEQELKFLLPVRFQDTLTATCTVKRKLVHKKKVILDCKVINQDGVLVLEGTALVKPPKDAPKPEFEVK
ncbi:MAG: MaoC family dehydratase [Oscillospiraceae bacterium]|nr:MaoC family dehydratase [Oscillospiraceae bacterium]